jgi:hypothetical protein
MCHLYEQFEITVDHNIIMSSCLVVEWNTSIRYMLHEILTIC